MEGGLETRPSVPANSLDIEKLLLEAQNRWLCPTEICHILRNYEKFGIASEPPNEPPSGSFFLFDRKVARNFRKDGHNWSRKTNGKLAKEGHKKLKIGSSEVLHCYYAHGEENENFQRRCYSMIEKDFAHIVLVHYLKVTGKSEDFSCLKEAQVAAPYSQGQESEEIMPNSNIDSSMCPGSHPNNCQVLSVSEYTDTAWLPNGAQALQHENAQSEYNHQASSECLELQQPAAEQIDFGGSDPKVLLFCPKWDPTQLDMGNCDMDAGGSYPEDHLFYPNMGNCDMYAGGSYPEDHLFYPNSFHESLSTIPGIESDPTQLDMVNSDTDAELGQLTDDLLDFSILEDDWGHCETFTPCGESIEHRSLSSSSRPDTVSKFVSNNVVKRLHFGGHLQIQEKSKASVEDSLSLSIQPMDQKLNSESACDATSKFHEQEVNHLELMDSVDPQQKRPDLRNNNSMENHFQRLLSNEKHGYVLSPDSDSESKFEGKSIYSSSTGQLLFDGLLPEQGSKKRSSSGDNGETGDNENENDVPSIPSEGKLDIQDINAAGNYSDTVEANLLLRFDTILCSGSSATNSVTSGLEYASQLSSKINSLLKGENNELDQMLKTGSGAEFSSEKLKDQLLQKHQKEKLREWILQKDAEGGDAPSILDEGGQGVLHLAAALGYDWALKPTIDAGVSVDLRDVNGCTALHWAAFCGRAKTVDSLISLDADPGALTEPSPKYPLGRTPADLASANGHKRIAVYLGKRPLGVHISSNNLDNQDDVGRGPKAVQNISEISAVPLSLGNASDCQSRKDLLATTSSFTISEIPPDLFEDMNHLIKRLRKDVADMNSLIARLGDIIGLLAHQEEIQSLRRRGRLHWRAVWPEDWGLEKEKEERKKRAPDPDLESEKAHKILKGPEDDEGPEKEKEEGKKQAPDLALESGKAYKILKAHLAYKALLITYYNVQSMKTIQMLVLAFVYAFKKIGERKLSHIDGRLELSAIRI